MATNSKMEKMVVIDVIRVYNEFGMKKELDARVQQKMQPYRERLDSLNSLYRMLSGDTLNHKNDLARLQADIEGLDGQINEAYSVSDKTINNEVWTRLNTLIDDYSKSHRYRIVLGANGMGTILFNEPQLDKTAELIQYINQKYAKGS